MVPRGSSYNGGRGILLAMGTAINVKQLSKDGRLDLIERLWDSLSDEELDSLPLAADQEEALDRRQDALEKEGPVGISSDELRKQIRGRSS
jgi:putative addiction module component (TIGR02574 family)